MPQPRKFFRVHRDEVWQSLSRHLGGGGTEWDGAALRVHHGPFVVTLDIHAELEGRASELVTRIRAAFVNPDEFRFRIRRRSVLGELAKIFGAQDVEVGDTRFDRDFILQANQPDMLRRLLSESKLRTTLLHSAAELVQVRDDEGWFGPEFPGGVDELRLEAPGRIVERGKLETLYAVFAEILNRLCHVGAAYEADPHLVL